MAISTDQITKIDKAKQLLYPKGSAISRSVFGKIKVHVETNLKDAKIPSKYISELFRLYDSMTSKEWVETAWGFAPGTTTNFSVLSGQLEIEEGLLYAPATIGVFTVLPKKIQELAGGIHVFGNTFSKMIGDVVAGSMRFNELSTSIVKSTSAIRDNGEESFELSSKLIKLAKDYRHLGVMSGDTEEVFKALSTTGLRVKNNFNDNALALTGYLAILKKFGVGTGDSTGLVNKFNTTLGFNNKETVDATNNIMAFAKATGISFSEAMSKANGGLDKFFNILDPNDMQRTQMFFDVVGKRAGVASESLFSMADAFDTMEGAQDTGAKLNSIFSQFGMTFDSVKVSMLDYTGRIEYITDFVREGLQNVSTMGPQASRLMMKALGEAGISAEMARGLANLKPGEELPVEQMLRAGQLPTMTTQELMEKAPLAVTVDEQKAAFIEAGKLAMTEAFYNIFGLSPAQAISRTAQATTTVDKALLDKMEQFTRAMAGQLGDAVSNTLSPHLGGVTSEFEKLKKLITDMISDLAKEQARSRSRIVG